MKLSGRLTFVFTAMGLLIVCAIAASSWLVSEREIRRSVDAALEERADALLAFTQGELGTLLRQSAEIETPPAGDRQPLLDSDETMAFLVLDSGAIVGDAPTDVSDETIQRVIAGERWFDTLDVDGRSHRMLALPVPEIRLGSEIPANIIGAVFFDDITAEEAAISALGFRLMLLGLVAIAAVALSSWFIGRWLARPLVVLTTAAEQLADQDGPVHRIEIDRADEIGRLSDQFNRLLSSLEVGREQQQRLVADASHELRTPLTALRMRAEFMASFPSLSEDQRSVATGAVEDVAQLSALVADLVDLASQAQTPDETLERKQLSTIVLTVIERTSLASGRRIDLDADESEAMVFPNMIRRAVQNLVDNAIKYSPADEPILVRVERGRVEVIDQGSGIAPEDLPFVFDRFFRSPKARNRPGNGIGLAIVNQVAEAHGGRAFAENEPSAGARVGLILS